MAKMTAAVGAMHFGARHAVAAIDGRPDAALNRREEAGPARSALELAIGHEQRLPARRAAERAGPLLVQQRARARPLGPVLAQDVLLLGRQNPPPLFFGLRDRKLFGLLGHVNTTPFPSRKFPRVPGHHAGRSESTRLSGDRPRR